MQILNNKTISYLKINRIQQLIKLLLGFMFLSFICLFFTNCAKTFDVSSIYHYEKEGVEFNPRTLMAESKPAFTFWLRKNDEVEILWEHLYILIRGEDSWAEDCDFSMEDCKDDLCSLELRWDAEHIGDSSVLVLNPNFIRSDDSEIILKFTNLPSEPNERDYRRACKNRDLTRPVFQANKSGLYRFEQFEVDELIATNHKGVTNGEAKIHALDKEENLSQTVTFDLTKERIDAIDYWRWQMPDDPVWSDNFSKNVKVTNIRILENGNQVRPSRVLYLPQFEGQVSGHGQEMDNQCFVNANTPNDHTITLKECRKSSNANSAVETNKITTPVYTQNEPPDLLSWFVEFNTNQGGEDASGFGALQVEFTIEAN